jgi:hypothetical protein
MAPVARRIQIESIALLLLLTLASYGIDKSDILVSYSFDDDNIETGPDTFAVFEHGKGCVDLTDSFRFSGYNSVEISDGTGDKDFSELQGYFPTRNTGKLYIHFAFLTTDSDDFLNIALAGPKFFNLTKDGIGFWLKTKNGYLYHVSDSMPKKLFPINEFRWYLFDITYDIDKGTYDLEITEENQYSPLVKLENQKNSSNNPKSVVNIFSFVTDPFTDKSNLTYYVDDVIIAVDEEILKTKFVAPGRKKYFVDMWDEYQYKLRQKPGCLPAIHPHDFGLDDDDIVSLETNGLLGYINDVANGKQFPKEQAKHLSTEHIDILNGIYNWNQGCRLLAENKPAKALQMFNSSDDKLDYAPIVELSRLFSLARLKRWDEVYDGLRNLYFEGLDDQRISVAQAIIGMSNTDLGKAEQWLETPVENVPSEFGDEAINITIKRIWSGEIDKDLFNIVKKYMPNDWLEFYEQALIAEQYFYVLLWQERNKEAAEFADKMIERLQLLSAPTSIWLQRRGDVAFYLKDYNSAKVYYERSLSEKGENIVDKVLFEKLSDVNYLTGDYDKERSYRERIYGSLVDKKCS